jgi:hypothetical protein
LPKERELLTQIGERTRGLAPAAVEALQHGLSAVQAKALGHASSLAKEAMLGRERDQGLGR